MPRFARTANGASPAYWPYPASSMHAVCRLAYVSPGASPSLAAAPRSAYAVKGSPARAAPSEAGAGGLPTAGFVTVAAGPLGAAAVQAVRTAQQQVRRQRPVRVRMG